jgi:viologen exporter family transport system permease protein
VAELVQQAGVYRRLLFGQVRGQASYRASFVLDLVANAAVPAIDLGTLLAIFHVSRTLGGFHTAQVLVMYGLAATAFAIADLVVGNIERIRTYVRQGLLDTVLIRPMSVLGQLVVLDFTPRRLARILVAGLVLVLAMPRAGVAWQPGTVALTLSTVVFGAVFFGALFVTSATVAFWWIDSGEFANGFTYGGRDFTSYPITVYSGAFRLLFAYGLGFAFVAYCPAVALLGGPDPLGLPAWLGWLGTPLVAVIAAAVATLVWRTGVRHYRSTGS